LFSVSHHRQDFGDKSTLYSITKSRSRCAEDDMEHSSVCAALSYCEINTGTLDSVAESCFARTAPGSWQASSKGNGSPWAHSGERPASGHWTVASGLIDHGSRYLLGASDAAFSNCRAPALCDLIVERLTSSFHRAQSPSTPSKEPHYCDPAERTCGPNQSYWCLERVCTSEQPSQKSLRRPGAA
jgi:hypothetical protein